MLQSVSVVDVLDGDVPPDVFRDRLVFVGATASGLRDTSATPFGSLLAGGLTLLWPVAAYLAFIGPGWHLELAAPLLAGGVALTGALRYEVSIVDARARQIRGVFSHYVSAEVVDEMLRDPERVQLDFREAATGRTHSSRQSNLHTPQPSGPRGRRHTRQIHGRRTDGVLRSARGAG